MESLYRRWFQQQSEDAFRSRSSQVLQRRLLPCLVGHTELFTPEADAGSVYSNVLNMIAGQNGDFFRLSRLLDAHASRSCGKTGDSIAPFVHWTGFGAFTRLSDAERQFLILKSLLLSGGQGGGVLIDDGEWLSLSAPFRSRVEGLARLLMEGRLKLKNRAVYLNSHLWSSGGALWGELRRTLGPGARMIANLDHFVADQTSRLGIVDPSVILTRDKVETLIAWSRGGRILLVPKSPLFTEAALESLRLSVAQSQRMELAMGVSYRLYSNGEGKIVVYDMPENADWKTFLTSMPSDFFFPAEIEIARSETLMSS
jgi:hypothetical protein